MKVPRRSARFLSLVDALDAEFARLGWPALPGQSADYLAETVEAIATQLRVGAAHALKTYVPDDWPAHHAARVVAQLEQRREALADTPAITLSVREAVRVVMALGLAADWTLRAYARDFMQARSALAATGSLHVLAAAIHASAADEVVVGGRTLGEARHAFVAAIGEMRSWSGCDCTDHERVPGMGCATMAGVADGLLLETLHLIGGALPSPDQHGPRHPLDPFLMGLDLGDLSGDEDLDD